MTGFWNTVIGKWIGGVLSVATIGLCVGIVTHLFEFWEVQAAVMTLTAEGETSKDNQKTIIDLMEGITEQMGQMMEKQDKMESLILTPDVVGRATVGDFGFDDAFVDINEDGKASMYLSAKQVMVSCEIDGLLHTFKLNVRGSFINRDDSGHLIIFSAKAGKDIGIDGVIKNVIVGPVE